MFLIFHLNLCFYYLKCNRLRRELSAEKLSLTLHLLSLLCLLQWNLGECTATPSVESYYPYFDCENTKKI